MYRKNNSVPSTVPWGTPDVTEEDLEDRPPQTMD